MNIFEELWADLKKIGYQLCSDETIWNQATLEIPKDPLNGDISTNIAMIIAAKNGGNPREVSLKFKEHLTEIPYIAHIEVAGPGFINFTIKAEKWHACIKSILNNDKDFWKVNVGKGEKVNVEYVSANPTGPMHIGHARGAVYGDALAKILSLCGYNVTKEYYINDAGSQIDTLLDSAFLRYREVLSGETVVIPQGLYPGDYLKAVGQKLVSEFNSSLLIASVQEVRQKIKSIVINEMLALIKSDLKELGVHHDIFFSEQSLHDSNKISNAVKILEEKALIYRGVLPPPKGQN
jgi:arginyl-tRNA synthetase